MQERKNKLLLITLIALTSATVLAFVYINGDDTVIVDKNIFRIEDLKTIDRIVLESGNKKTELAFAGSGWTVNQQYPADQRMIEVLFATLQQAEPKREVASGIKDSIAKELDRSGVLISLFSDGVTKMNFLAGGNETKSQAYFKDDTGNIYVMVIPGYRVYVTGIFEMGESDFRDKYVFGFNWRNFKGLTVKFPLQQKENFKVSMQSDYFTVEGLARVDTARLNTFLDQISLLTVDQWTDSSIDSTTSQQPMMVVTIEDIAKRTYELKLFSPARKKVFGLVNGEPAYFNSERIQSILRPKSFFARH